MQNPHFFIQESQLGHPVGDEKSSHPQDGQLGPPWASSIPQEGQLADWSKIPRLTTSFLTTSLMEANCLIFRRFAKGIGNSDQQIKGVVGTMGALLLLNSMIVMTSLS